MRILMFLLFIGLLSVEISDSMQYIKSDKIDNGYRIKKKYKIKVLQKHQLINLYNQKGVDEFTHLGYTYTSIMGSGKTIVETEEYVITECDISLQEAEALVSQEPELNPYILNAEEIEAILPEPLESGVSD